MARQKQIPGTEREKPIEEIELAAEAYRKTAERLTSARKKTQETRDALIELLRKHGREQYRAENGRIYAITLGKTKITVTDTNDGGEGDEGDEADVD